MRRATSFLLVSAAFVAATSASGAPPALRAASPQPIAVKSTVVVATPKPVAVKSTVVVAPKPVAAHHVARVARVVVHKRFAVRHAAPHGIAVPMDEVRVIQFSSPVSTVYVGNPTIADVSMIDNRHAFVLGKGFGATNLVALDTDGKQVVNDAISVYARTGSTVTLMRGAAQTTYACGGARCENTPMPGDDKDSFDVRMGQIEKHQDMNVKAASEGH
ncbi:MAG TPA: pilus assembly protein N-terminal domain-containing protein [Rhizomicrobium sp.]|jgi:Flp pilus assembly secretin CpaC